MATKKTTTIKDKTEKAIKQTEQEALWKGKQTDFNDLDQTEENEILETTETSDGLLDSILIQRKLVKKGVKGEIMKSELISTIYFEALKRERKKFNFELPIDLTDDFDRVRNEIGVTRQNAMTLAMSLFISLYDGYEL